MLSNSALHLWLAFSPDGSSHNNFFNAQPGQSYPTGDKTPDLLGRKAAWDVDSDLPEDLGNFIAEALKEFFTTTKTNSNGAKGQCAPHPTIWDSIVPGSGGYINGSDVVNTYWWVYHYLKYISTDYYKIRRPEAPDFFVGQPFPSPPGSGESDPGPGSSDDSAWHDFLEILLAIFAWIIYLAEVAAWPVTEIISLITSAGTYPVRELLYENLELPLYNAWLALHWYLCMSGFTYPMQQELNPGLNILGIGVGDVWNTVQNALNDLDGGLFLPPVPSENSGWNIDPNFPFDVVTDPQGLVSGMINQLLNRNCGAAEAPSEFLRPWLWPAKDNQGDPVPSERKLTKGSPYAAGQDCMVFMGGLTGAAATRDDYESAKSEAETMAKNAAHIPAGQTLGDAVDFTSYMIGKLTRDNPIIKANFNMDSDRGYAYQCWDWKRSKDLMGVPDAFKSDADKRKYHLPLHPGTGWCKDEAEGDIPQNPATNETGVNIRYIDKEEKYL